VLRIGGDFISLGTWLNQQASGGALGDAGVERVVRVAGGGSDRAEVVSFASWLVNEDFHRELAELGFDKQVVCGSLVLETNEPQHTLRQQGGGGGVRSWLGTMWCVCGGGCYNSDRGC
jgi:hypothetical protein